MRCLFATYMMHSKDCCYQLRHHKQSAHLMLMDTITALLVEARWLIGRASSFMRGTALCSLRWFSLGRQKTSRLDSNIFDWDVYASAFRECL